MWWLYILSFFLGGYFGMLIMCLLIAASRATEREKKL